MRKIYTTLLMFAMAGSMAFAQSAESGSYYKDKSDPTFIITNDNIVKPYINSNNNKGIDVIIYEDDFSNPDTWVIDQNPDAFQVDWQIGLGLDATGDAAIETINSTTNDNGYAMLDSDVMNNSTGVNEDSWLTMANPVDLTDFDKIVVEFETMYRSWTDETAFLVLSTDPNVWPALVPTSNADTIVGVYKVFPEILYGNQSSPTDNPRTIQINVSDFAANQPVIYVRFNWTGQFGYAWFVDDFKIIDQPANDVKMILSRLSHNGLTDNDDPDNFKLREQYARIPASQVTEFYTGAESFNFGFESQTNVNTSLEVRDINDQLVFGFTNDEAELAPNDTIFPTELIPIVLENGQYSVVFTVTSDQESEGENFGNNQVLRGLEISTDYYSLDGIGLHPEAQVGSTTVGDNPDTEPDDGYRVMTHYDINDLVEVFGIEVLLRSEFTVPGGIVIASIIDSTDMQALNFDAPLVESDEHEITQEDIDAGYIRMYFADPITLGNASVYASIEMFVSIGGDNDSPISILDDRTVKQISWASAIYVPTPAPPAVFTNPTAAAIRLMLNGSVGIEEVKEEVAVLSQNVPNPASKLTRIDFELLSSQNVSVIITDIQGKLISNENLGTLPQGAHQYTFDVSSLKAGIYQYTILTENGKLTKTMSVIK